MNYQGPFTYQLEITGPDDCRKITSKKQNGVEVKFTAPVTHNKRPKVYVIQDGHDIVYVGYASQSITNRLSGGFKAKGKNGYHGYGWKKLTQVTLSVFVFDPLVGKKGDENYDKHRLNVEAVEAELVYQVRKTTGKWPLWQSEIHFNNSRREDVLKISEDIYKELTSN